MARRNNYNGDFGLSYQSLVFRGRKTKAVKGIMEKKEKKGDDDDDYLNKRSSSGDHCEFLGKDRKGAYGGIVGFAGVNVKDVYVVVEMEYVETDLRSYIADLNKKEGFTINEVKKLMRQLLEGVKFLHENGVMHGDLKPHNILINKGKGGGDLKICNFGRATRFGEAKGSYSPQVGATRWYRAPELLAGVKGYSSEVDMWNVGCIMAELVLDKVGEDEEDEIYRILGRSAYSSKKRSSSINSYAKFVLKEDGFDLLKGLLSKDPSKRITAESALNHVWFHDASWGLFNYIY